MKHHTLIRKFWFSFVNISLYCDTATFLANEERRGCRPMLPVESGTEEPDHRLPRSAKPDGSRV